MNKKLCSVLLALLILCSAVMPVFAEEPESEEVPVQREQLRITSTEDFLSFAENCRLDSFSRNLDVILSCDIDLSGTAFHSIPIFSGTFDGKGHTISGFLITKDGSAQGLFRYLTKTAVVRDITVTAAIHPAGSRDKIGTIAGSNEGLIQNCIAEAEVSGNNMVGGIAGINGVSGIIETCEVRGVIQGTHFVGGIAGQNNGVVRDCKNLAAINTTAQQNEVDLSDVTLGSLTNTEQANTVTDVGGIAGTSSGVIRSCKNAGNVGYQHMGYNIGGIAGTQNGYVVDCENTGHVQGRKEVGGIVGQMEPVSLIEYEEDLLQILQGQLEDMSGTVNKTAANIQNAGGAISSQTSQLQGHMEKAKESLELLMPNPENPGLPDSDTIQAAQNGISSSLNGMQQTVQSMSATVNGAMAQLSGNVSTLQKQINAMSATLDNASDTLGGSIEDASDLDTEIDLTGKVESCANFGSVLGDRNVGGIAGAMAMENDLDVYSDWEITGESSLNFESKVRCVIVDCENRGLVTAKKSHGGGITGCQTLGLVKQSRNIGAVGLSNAQYMGGISGQSNGFIRGCTARCTVSGKRYVGGVAGSAAVATDCFAVVEVNDAKENIGAILGDTEENLQDIELPFAGNTYLVIGEDLGGIDGISYDTQAQPLPQTDFFAQEALPELLRSCTVSFRLADDNQVHITVPAGGNLDPARIPTLPEKDGFTAYWAELEQEDLTNILFDMTFVAQYVSHSTTIQSDLTAEKRLPLVLAEGYFYPDAEVTAASISESPMLNDRNRILGVWQIEICGYQTLTYLRLQIPEGCDSDRLALYTCDQNGRWNDTEFTVDGSYLVFEPEGGSMKVALTQTAPSFWHWYLIGIGAILLLGVLVTFRYIRRRNAASNTK